MYCSYVAINAVGKGISVNITIDKNIYYVLYIRHFHLKNNVKWFAKPYRPIRKSDSQECLMFI